MFHQGCMIMHISKSVTAQLFNSVVSKKVSWQFPGMHVIRAAVGRAVWCEGATFTAIAHLHRGTKLTEHAHLFKLFIVRI
jgi:hypothetical protein